MKLHCDGVSTQNASEVGSAARVTVTSEAERRAHVARWIARHHKSAAATLGSAMLFLPAVAGAQTTGDGLVNAAGIDGVRDVQVLDDGSARITLDNGHVMNVSAGDVVVGDAGEVQVSNQVADILAEAAAAPAAGGGGAGAIAAGAAAGVAGIAAASGGGGDGGGGGSDPAPVVLNASDVEGFNTFSDVFGRTPEGDPDRVTITVDDGEGIELTAGEGGDWDLPEDFAENFADREGEVTVSFLAEREIPDDEDENGTVEVIVEDGETLASQTLADGEPDFEDADSGSITLLVDTIRPTIDINEPITDGDALNIAERGEDLTITGTTDAEDGQEVTVMMAGQTYTGTASGGLWSVAIPAAALAALPDDADITLEATVADAAGNPVAAPASVSFATDFTAPTIGIGEVSGNDILTKANEADGVEITGTTDAEDGQEVTVTFNGTTYIATVASGAWSVPVPAADLANLDTGDTPTISATVSDGAGNPAAAPVTRDLDVDLTGPTLSIGQVADDDIINIAESGSDVTISGTSSGANGEPVTVTIDRTDATGTPTILDTTATADAITGDWSVTLDAATAGDLFDGGTFTIAANVTDFEGVDAPEATRDFTTDFTAPEITIETPIAGDDNTLNTAERDAGFDISGTTDAENGQEVTVTLTGAVATPEVTATGTAQGGNWTVNFTPAQAAELDDWETVNVEASVADAAGNPADTPATATFDTDFTAPDITVDDLGGLTGGAELTAADLLDANGEPLTDPLTLNGTSDATGGDVTVTIGALTRPAIVAGDDTWSVDFSPTELLDEVSTESAVSIEASVEDEAGNPGMGTLDLGVDLGPEITIAEPADTAALGLEAFEGGLAVSGSTQFVPDGQNVTVNILVPSGAVVATTTAPVTGGAWSGNFDASDIAGLTDESSFTLEASVNNGFASQDGEATQAITTDFAPELTIGEIGDEGVLILDDIDPANVSVSGTTRGVEAGQAVTVTLLDEGGATIFTDDSATVAADGTWTLDLPESEVNGLDAGQTYDVQADVSNAAGRAAPQAQEQVVAYEAAPSYLVEESASGTQVTMEILLDPRGEVPADGGLALGETVTFDTTEITYLASPAPIYASGFVGQTNANNATSGEVTFGGIGIAPNFDIDEDFLVQFAMDQQTTTGLIQLDVTSTEGGNYSSLFGTSAADTIAANNVDTLIRGRGGDDDIDLSGVGVNTVQFEADPTANGFDTVTDFSLGGPLPDRLGFAGLNNADLRGDGDTFELLSGTDSVGADTGLIVFTTAMADLTAGSVQAAVDDLDGPADGDVLYFLASDGTDAQLYEVQVQSGDDQVTDMARFEGLGDLSGISEANILGFEATGTLT